MKKIPALCLSCLLIFFAHAQQPNWGWGLPVTVTQSGSSITLSVFDPELNQDKTKSVTADQYINNQGVVAALDAGNKVTYHIYDINTHTWEEGLEYISGSIDNFSNEDGVVAFSETGTSVHYAVYDPIAREWKEDLEYLEDDGTVTLVNKDGVVAFAETGPTIAGSYAVRYAFYDPVSKEWKEDLQYISHDSQVQLTNTEGVVAFAETGTSFNADYAVHDAVYDPGSRQWKEGLEYIARESNIDLVNKDGIVAFAETGTSFNASYGVYYAVYDPASDQWKESNISIGNNETVTNLDIQNGTVFFDYDGSSHQKGYNVNSHQWSDNTNTGLYCELFISDDDGSAPFITHFSCLSIGANNYSYNTDDAHNITRRWGWKQYNNPDSYNAQLTVSNSTSNSSCSGNVDVSGLVGISNYDQVVKPEVYPNPASGQLTIRINPEVSNTALHLVDVLGRSVFHKSYRGQTIIELDLDDLAEGVYMLYGNTNAGRFVRKVCIAR